MSAILFSGKIGPVPVTCILTETHGSTLGITENPIETGAKITDHAYVEPKTLKLSFADAGAALTYQELVRFQESRVPFTAVSGLSVYKNMLIKSLDAERDVSTSHILKGSADLQEVIIVSTAYAAAEPGQGAKSAGKPGGKKSTQAARPTAANASNPKTAARSSGTVTMGDSPTAPASASNQSALSAMLGS